MSFFLGGGQTGRRLVNFSRLVTPAAAPAGVWTAQGWWRFPGRCVLDRIHVLLPPGVAGTLWLRPVYRQGANLIIDLPVFNPGGVGYITGDDLVLDLHLLERLDARHELGVMVQHTGAVDHSYNITYEVELGGFAHG